MKKLSKRLKQVSETTDFDKKHKLEDAIDILKNQPKLKFVESIDIAIRLGIDAKKSDQVVRGSLVLPNGTGKKVRVAVICKEDKIQEAKDAKADVVGFDDLLEDIGKQVINFDTLIATPDVMSALAKVARILGPKGLMPNPKLGTVTKDIAKAVNNAKSGQVSFRNEKNGIVHSCVGKASFDTNQLAENVQALISEVKRLKPSSSKGIYLNKITLSSTMGVGLDIEV